MFGMSQENTQVVMYTYFKGKQSGRIDLSVSLSYDNTIELFDELIEDLRFADLMTYFTMIGAYVDSRATDRIALRIDDQGFSKIWVAYNKEEE